MITKLNEWKKSKQTAKSVNEDISNKYQNGYYFIIDSDRDDSILVSYNDKIGFIVKVDNDNFFHLLTDDSEEDIYGELDNVRQYTSEEMIFLGEKKPLITDGIVQVVNNESKSTNESSVIGDALINDIVDAYYKLDDGSNNPKAKQARDAAFEYFKHEGESIDNIIKLYLNDFFEALTEINMNFVSESNKKIIKK